MKYKAQVNQQFHFDLSLKDINQLDLVEDRKNTFHILQDAKSYRAKVETIDYPSKTATILINHRSYAITLSDEFDQLISQLGLELIATAKISDIKAPMPGLVLDVAVGPGQAVKKGDKLFILEAMKMENVIKSDGEGIIKTIHVEQGAAVEKGQLLIEME